MKAILPSEMPAPIERIESEAKVAQISTMKAGMHACGRCPNIWGGLNTSHCGACHRSFTGLSAFDKHRDGSHSAGTRRCVDPETVGLVNAGRDYPCWGLPGGDDRWDDR